jgi:metallo-beta-lactamase family protein
MVIAGSGMLSGGRILHHLRAHLDEPAPHAGRGELLAWAASAGGAEVRLVRGEPAELRSLRDALAAQGRSPSLQPSKVALPEGGPRDEGGE